MCKIAIITQHNPSERDAIIARVWAYFSQSGENDGFGAAWLDEQGKLAYVKRRHASPSLFHCSRCSCLYRAASNDGCGSPTRVLLSVGEGCPFGS